MMQAILTIGISFDGGLPLGIQIMDEDASLSDITEAMLTEAMETAGDVSVLEVEIIDTDE